MTRFCNQRVVINKEDTGPCEIVTVNPHSPYCYWHRLLVTEKGGQQRAAELRLAAAPLPHRDRVPPSEWPPGERWCPGCQHFVPLFYVTGSRCKACARIDAASRRRESIYGITDEVWDSIMFLQSGLCAICRRKQRDRAPATEHNHSTGRFRGGCCVNCNHKVLGGAFDSPRIVMAAVVYLLRPPADGAWIPPEDCVDDLLALVTARLDEMALSRGLVGTDEVTDEVTNGTGGR